MSRTKTGRRKKTLETVKNDSRVKDLVYKETDTKKLELHKAFLQALKKDEDDRLTTIEQKTSQLFSQTGIIVAVLALFIPLIIEKVEPVSIRVLFIGVLSLAGFYYLRTIYAAGRNLEINKFNYQRSAASTVLDPALRTPEMFMAEEINDLLNSIPVQIKLNNEKGSNLLNAHRSFKVANVVTGLLSVSLCLTIALTYQKAETTKTRIDGTVRTEDANSISYQDALREDPNSREPTNSARTTDSENAAIPTPVDADSNVNDP